MAVGARLSADELTPGGMTIEDCIEAVLHLHEHGLLDFVSLVLGHSAFPAASTWIAPPPPTPAAAIGLPAAAVRAALPRSLPVLATTRVVDLGAADRLIRDGVADLIGLTRALIADPSSSPRRSPARPTRSSSASAVTRPASATTTPACRSAAPSTPGPAAS